MTSSTAYHAGIRLAPRIKIRSGMSVISAASIALAQSAAVEQAVEAKAFVAVVVIETGTDADLPRSKILLLP